MSEIILFAGPSIAGLDGLIPREVSLRPPVQQGDVYLATRAGPRAIAILDGFFEGAPAVWHKEILWALTRGTPVLGASSMGALRAAEMDVFGMVGLGAIYEGYRDGWLEDDDEVALLHGPADMGYPTLSLAMVNARATLAAAQAAGVLAAPDADRLIAKAKAQFYKSRSWETVLADEDTALRGWVAAHAVDQKKADAALLLRHLARGAFEQPDPGVHFEEAALWHAGVQSWRQRAATADRGDRTTARVARGASLFDE